MSNDEVMLEWGKAVPDREISVENLDSDDYGFRENDRPFDGIAVSHYPNGQIESRRPCLNGMPHGECQWWHDNGQISEKWSAYRGMGHGWSTEWYETGVVARKVYSEFGRPLEWSEFDQGGKLIKEGTNRENRNALLWIQRCRDQMPDAP